MHVDFSDVGVLFLSHPRQVFGASMYMAGGKLLKMSKQRARKSRAFFTKRPGSHRFLCRQPPKWNQKPYCTLNIVVPG